ncbi:MAG TPA: hypothetical protein VFS39_13505 [Nitrospira sp.]|nr:hypothetical protein [Nitrospira sp.]
MTRDRIAAFNQAIEREVAAAGAKLVNLHAIPVREEWIFTRDGFHSDNEGHQMITQAFLTVILPALNLR